MIKKNVDVVVFTLHYPFVNQSYKWNGVEVIPLNGKNNFIVRKTILYQRLKTAFEKVNRYKKIDIIHSFWLNETTYFANKIANKFKLPIIATAQGQDVLDSNNYLQKINWKEIMICCISNFQKIKLENQINEPIKVINLGVEKPLSIEKEFDLIGVGNLIKLKNFRYFIELCQELKKYNPKFRAKIIGKGQERSELLDLIEVNNLLNNIELVGELSYKETQLQISKAKILVHPSNFEGFGMVLIEALANQTHVLSSPVGIAYDESSIVKLKFDIKNDLSLITDLLISELPMPIVYPISKTVTSYLKIYKDL